MKMTKELWHELGFIGIVEEDHTLDHYTSWRDMDIVFSAKEDWTVSEVLEEVYRAGYRKGARNFRNAMRRELEYYEIDMERNDYVEKDREGEE